MILSSSLSAGTDAVVCLAEKLGDARVMRDDDQGELLLPRQSVQKSQDLLLDRRVERDCCTSR